MIRIENHCVGCTDLGMHCIGSHCRNRHVEVHYCDKCDPNCVQPLHKVLEVDGEELCEDCLKEKFRKE